MKHYLIGMDRTVCLDRATPMIAGRSSDSFWMLSDPRASRQHARFTSNGRTCSLRDLNSSGGTRVNGKPIEAINLRHGDVIQMVSHNFVYCHTDDPAELERLETSLRSGAKAAITLTGSAIKDAAPNSDFSGSLSKTELWEVCQLIEGSGKNGRLTVRDRQEKGVLYFRGGLVIGAEFHEEHGIPAAKRVTHMRQGHFAFSHGDFSPQQPLNTPLMTLALMALAQGESGSLDIDALDTVSL